MAGIPAGPLLLVSPHLDDAVLSCEALIQREEPIDVLTVATGAPDPPRQGWWDRETGFADSNESVAARRREDEDAFVGTPHRRAFLPLLELQHQEGGRTGEDEEVLADALRAWVDVSPGRRVALPAGAGCREARLRARFRRLLGRKPCSPPQHPDHLWVRDVGLAALDGAPADLLLYEELPYLFGAPADRAVEEVARRTGRAAERVELEIDRSAKAKRIGAYASQISHLSDPGRPLDHPASLPPIERYWLLTRPATTAP